MVVFRVGLREKQFLLEIFMFEKPTLWTAIYMFDFQTTRTCMISAFAMKKKNCSSCFNLFCLIWSFIYCKFLWCCFVYTNCTYVYVKVGCMVYALKVISSNISVISLRSVVWIEKTGKHGETQLFFRKSMTNIIT